MKRLTIGILCAFGTTIAMSQTTPTDSVNTRELDEIVVEARSQRLGAEVSTYVPTSKQKNAAISASDLLDRMAIPQLNISPDGSIKALSGKQVDVFIEFLPASTEDMSGMRMQDVKKIEYYDFPSDPRFMGKAHVVNFIMQKYEYGGYLKTMAWESTVNAGYLGIYSKMQYRRMTFDIAAGGFYKNNKHSGEDTYEIFRLPQSDGSLNIFERNSIQDISLSKYQQYWPTFKALYKSDRISINNVIGANFYRTPNEAQSGHIEYSPEIAQRTDYTSASSNRVNSISYSGYWNFIIDDKNSINFSPRYAYSHTNTQSRYSETGSKEYINTAIDNSHQFNSNLTYAHSFGEWGNLNTMLQSIISTSNTTYAGTANMSDYTRTYRIGPGIQYSLSKGKFYGLAGFGFHWNRQDNLNFKETSTAPWIDLSLQYSPNDRHSLRSDFHHMKSIPSSNFLSTAIIQSNPLMSYTGNPNLIPFNSYDVGLNYSFIPNNRYSLSAFFSAWIADNRYIYDYEPTATGILRTIKQPGGEYWQCSYGIYGSVRLFDRSLQLTAQLNANSVHNGAPYNLNKTRIGYAINARYYLDNWSFSAIYYSAQGYPDGYMVGTWMETKPTVMLQAGWANASWNILMQVFDFTKWNWKGNKSSMHSPYYDKIEQFYSINSHACAKITLTYTFGFGKKIERGNEASQQSGISSGILK